MMIGNGLSLAKDSINEGIFSLFPICPWNIISMIVSILIDIWS